MIKVGTAGFNISRSKYYKKFSFVEINSTFYNIPEIELAHKWKSEAPANFEFIIKAWQIITHPASSFTYRRLKEKIGNPSNYGFFRDTPEVHKAWSMTLEFADKLGARKILIQTPKSFGENQENIYNLKKFLGKISGRYEIIMEIRGDFTPNTLEKIFREFNIIECIDPLHTEKNPAGRFNYFRLHGTYKNSKIDYNYSFSKKELNSVYERCNKKLNYIVFNNTDCINNATTFIQTFKLLDKT